MKKVRFDESVTVRRMDVTTSQHISELRSPASVIVDMAHTSTPIQSTVLDSSNEIVDDYRYILLGVGVLFVLLSIGIVCIIRNKNRKKNNKLG